MIPAKLIQIFIRSAGVLLLAMSASLVVSTWTSGALIQPRDPVLGISIHKLFLIVAVIAGLVALICLFGEKLLQQLTWILWFSAIFEIYQFGLLGDGGRSLSVYLTDFHAAFGISAESVTVLAEVSFASLFLGGCIALLLVFTGAVKLPASTNDCFKIFCPVCLGKIQFAVQDVGREIACPHCRAPITLQEPANLKMTCILCGGHIEFPVYGLGQKIPCPHCRATITLKMLDQ